jgi:hypothetical protein
MVYPVRALGVPISCCIAVMGGAACSETGSETMTRRLAGDTTFVNLSSVWEIHTLQGILTTSTESAGFIAAAAVSMLHS